MAAAAAEAVAAAQPRLRPARPQLLQLKIHRGARAVAKKKLNVLDVSGVLDVLARFEPVWLVFGAFLLVFGVFLDVLIRLFFEKTIRRLRYSGPPTA